MKFSITRTCDLQVQVILLNRDDSMGRFDYTLLEMTAWVGLTVLC
jgi:hypothetical protein